MTDKFLIVSNIFLLMVLIVTVFNLIREKIKEWRKGKHERP